MPGSPAERGGGAGGWRRASQPRITTKNTGVRYSPTSVTPSRFIALDISPMLQAVLGRVFRQAGVQARMLASGASAQASVGISEAGVSGGTQLTKSFTDGTLNISQNIVPCSQLSPISNSNLVFVQETATGTTMATGGVSISA